MPNKEKLSDVFEEIINKQLEPFNATINNVVELYGETWYDTLTTTYEQEKQFKKWAIDLLKRKFRWNNSKCEREIDFFLLCYGLKITDDTDSLIKKINENEKTNINL
jgi:hypothetical protein